MTGSISEPNPPVSQAQKVEVEQGDPNLHDSTKDNNPLNQEKLPNEKDLGKDRRQKKRKNKDCTLRETGNNHGGSVEKLEDLSLQEFFETTDQDLDWKDQSCRDGIWEEGGASEQGIKHLEAPPEVPKTTSIGKDNIQDFVGNVACLLPEPRLFVDVVLDNQVRIPALLDTGADFSMISEELVATLGVKTNPSGAIPIQGMGRIESSLGHVKLEIKICDNVFEPATFQVMRGMQRTQVWLGRSFFWPNRLVVDYITERIKQRRPDGSVWEVYISKEDKGNHVQHARIPVHITETAKLDAESVTKVEVCWEQVGECEDKCWHCSENRKELYFEPDVSNQNINIHPGILEGNSGTILISKSEQVKGDKIKKGTVIGWVSPTVEYEKSYNVGFTMDSEDNDEKSTWTPQDVIDKIKLGTI